MEPGLKSPEDRPMAEAERWTLGGRESAGRIQTRASCQMLWALQKARHL